MSLQIILSIVQIVLHLHDVSAHMIHSNTASLPAQLTIQHSLQISPNVNLTQNCNTDTQCRAFAVCRNSQCQCLYGALINGSCLCTTAEHCLTDNSQCRTLPNRSIGLCQCRPGFYFDPLTNECIQPNLLDVHSSTAELTQMCLILSLLLILLFCIVIFCKPVRRFAEEQDTIQLDGESDCSSIHPNEQEHANCTRVVGDAPPPYSAVVVDANQLVSVTVTKQ